MLLAATSGAAFLSFRQGRAFYHELQATKLDPLGLRGFRMPAHEGEVMLAFYGDSRAAQWPVPAWLQGRTLNLGIGGQTTEQILGRFDPHVLPLKPRIVLLQAGMNDLKTIPIFPRREPAIIATCKENLRRIIGRCEEAGIHVIVTTIFPVGAVPLERRPFWSDRVDPAIEEVNGYLRMLASDKVSVFDSAKHLTGPDGRLVPEYGRDLLHLSAAGYEVLNAAFEKEMKEVIKAPTSH